MEQGSMYLLVTRVERSCFCIVVVFQWFKTEQYDNYIAESNILGISLKTTLVIYLAILFHTPFFFNLTVDTKLHVYNYATLYSTNTMIIVNIIINLP